MPAENLEEQPLLESSTKSSKQSSRWITVEPLILFVAAAGVSGIVVPQYIEYRLAQDYNVTLVKDDSVNGTCDEQNTTSPEYKIQQVTAAESAAWLTLSTAITYIPALFVAPFYGALCDQLGRKVSLLIPTVGGLLTSIVQLIVMYLNLPIALYACASIISGLGGGYCFFLAGCYAYIADVSSKTTRLLRLAVIQTVGIATTGLLQLPFGYFIAKFGFIPPYWYAIALYGAAIIYIVIPGCLQEPIRVRSLPSSKMSLVRDIARANYNLFQENTQKRRTRLLLILLIYFFVDIIQLSQGASITFIIYGLGPPFCWSSVTLGYFKFLYMASAGLGLLIGSKLFSICLGDFWILQIAFIFGLFHYLTSALAPNTTIFMLGTIVGGFRAMDAPATYTILSKMVTPEEQGAVFGVESSIQSIANMLSPLILNTIYIATVDTMPSAVFFAMASIFVIVIVLSWIWMSYSKKILGEKYDAIRYGRLKQRSPENVDNHLYRTSSYKNKREIDK